MTGHRRAVRDAVLDATAHLIAEQGLAITMSDIAGRAGIGRATLYRHFPDVDAVLTAWHERLIAEHLQQLADVRDHADGSPAKRLAAVLAAYARLSSHRHGGEPAARLHRSEHVTAARAPLRTFLAGLIAEAARAGEVRADVPAEELADYALGALSAAAEASEAAVERLVAVTVAGLRRPPA